ncbi:MAG TPA: nucleoside-diphosphate kinase [Saprospiraceae bacterium]|nr:nucleoside-diphosphate kinase [Saprospiraceae bacterium]
MERTLLLIKPDAIQRGLIGEIISRIEKKGLKFTGIKMIQLSDEILQEHYAHIKTKPFFGKIAEFMKSAPVIACCVEGLDAVETVRSITGVTKAREAQPGTIRGDLGMSIQTNLVHTSDSKDAAKEEINRFFKQNDIFEYIHLLEPVIYSEDERK